MTLYEVLSLISPVLTIILCGLVGFVFKSITESIRKLDYNVNKRIDGIDKRIDRLDSEFIKLNSEIHFIKGLMQQPKEA